MKKKILLLLLLVTGVALMFAGGQQDTEAAADDIIVLKFGSHQSIATNQHEYMEKWISLVEERSNGRVDIQYFPGSQLGNEREILEAVKLGSLDIGMADHAYLSSYLPEWGLFDLPFIFRDYNHLEAVLDGEVEERINNKMALVQNLRHLGWMHTGFREIISKKPLRTFDDLKGLKIRSPETRVFMSTFNALNAKPTPIPWGEVYTAMKSGIVDAMGAGPQSIFDMHHYDTAKYLTRTQHIQTAVGPCINEQKWQSLPDDIKAIMLDTLKELLPEQRALTIKQNDEAIDKMRELGIEIIELSIADRKKMSEAVTPFWSEYAADAKAEDLLQMIIDTK